MISSFTVSNFKAFGPPQNIPLKPITLIFGPNSAGKSSIIHSLLFAHESLRTGNLDVRQTEIGGQSVDLGGFQQLTHGCNPDNSVTLEFHLPDLGEGKPQGWMLANVVIRATLQMQKASLSTGIDFVDDLLRDEGIPVVGGSVGETVKLLERILAGQISGEGGAPVLRRFEIEADGKPLVQASRRPERGLKIDSFATGHPICRTLIEAIVLANSTTQSFNEADAKVVAGELDELITGFELDEYGFLARSKRQSLSDVAGNPEFASIGKEKRDDDLRRHARQFLPRLINGLFDVVSSTLQTFFDRLDYLGPLRSYPPRHLSLDSVSESGKAEGTDAWKIIQRSSRSAVPELTLMDKRTGTFVSHRDIGIGVSQLLPVLVKAYASKNGVISIEQPEIHLHPALQAELADVFIDSALGDQKNTFLLETHSEHLILRLLRRIRETAAGTLPPDSVPIRPADVAILYVKPGPDGSSVCELPVNDDGDFDEPWPDGFFPERTKELF